MNSLPKAFVVKGDLVTMDPARPRAEAVAIADGRIAAVGSREEALAASPPGSPELSLPGTVLPGLIDSHIHMLWGGRDAERMELGDVESVAELLGRVRAFAAENPERPWLAGSAGIDAESLAENRFPSAAELDEAAAGRPLFLDRRSHDAIVNGAALAAAGIGADTADPPGGVIERDEAGAATGFLVERPAAELVESAMPAPSLEDRLRWLATIQPHIHAAGITSVVDPALEAEEMRAFEAAAARDELTVRTTGMPLGDGEVPPAERAAAFEAAGVDLGNRDGAAWRVGPWKLFLDGGGSLGTAMLNEPWPGSDDYYGNQTTSTEGLFEYARWAARTGAGLGVHAVGSAAIDLFLDVCAAAAEQPPAHGPRGDRPPLEGLGFTLIHAYLWPSRQQMTRCRELGVLVATQSPLQWSFGPGLVRRFGAEAIGRAHPMRSWLESGAVVGGGSDGRGYRDDAPADPLWAFWQMRRRTISGSEEAVGPQEAVDAEQALALYTTGAAAVALAPDRGRLTAGAVADLVAVSVDPLAATPEECRDGTVLTTMIGGRIVHEA